MRRRKFPLRRKPSEQDSVLEPEMLKEELLRLPEDEWIYDEAEMKIVLPMPISINMAYAGQRRRYMSGEYKAWLIHAFAEMAKQKKYRIRGDAWLSVKYVFKTPLFFKNGKKKVWDVFNREKVLSDFLTKSVPGFEDHKIKEGIVQKEDSEENVVEVTIKEI